MKNFVVTSRIEGVITKEAFYTNWEMTEKENKAACVILNKAMIIAKDNINVDFKFWSNQINRIEIELDNLQDKEEKRIRGFYDN